MFSYRFLKLIILPQTHAIGWIDVAMLADQDP